MAKRNTLKFSKFDGFDYKLVELQGAEIAHIERLGWSPHNTYLIQLRINGVHMRLPDRYKSCADAEKALRELAKTGGIQKALAEALKEAQEVFNALIT